jgi:hypothetical protein
MSRKAVRGGKRPSVQVVAATMGVAVGALFVSGIALSRIVESIGADDPMQLPPSVMAKDGARPPAVAESGGRAKF